MLIALIAAGQNAPCPQPGSPVVSYTWEPIPRSYADIDGLPGTVLVSASTGCIHDSIFYVPFPGGLTIFYDGFARTGLYMSEDGFLFIGGFVIFPPNFAVGANSNPARGIYPWYDDLIMSLPDSKLLVRSDQDAVTFEWKSMQLLDSLSPAGCTGSGSYSFQVKLYTPSHPTLANKIDFVYGPSTPRATMPCNPALASTDSGFIASATVGIESYTYGNLFIEGTDPTDRGAGNTAFPPTDIRFTRNAWDGTESEYAFSWNQILQEPFCSIESRPGTIAVSPPCAPASCYSHYDSAWYDGAPITIPWKFTLGGRAVRSASMNAEGFLRLGPGRFATPAVNLPAASGHAFSPLLAPFWDEGLEGGPDSRMLWRVDGVPGCRVMTFEWLRFHGTTGTTGACITDSSRISFQIKLLEGGAAGMTASCPQSIVPGGGFDRIEFHYDHGGFIAGNFSASIGLINQDATVGREDPANPNVAAPPPGMKWVATTCDSGTVRHYGDATTNAPPGLQRLPEIAWNGCPPRLGNPFGVNISGGTPGAEAILFIDPQGFAGTLGPPVPCGGVAFGPIRAWVDVLAVTTVVSTLGPLDGATASDGCKSVPLAIPFAPALAGQFFFLQAAAVGQSGTTRYVEATAGMRVVLGL